MSRRPLCLVVAVALMTTPALLALTEGPASAAGVTSPNGCGPAVHKVATNSTPVSISTAGTPVVTSTLNVTGAGLYLTDVDVITGLLHTFSSDIDMTITSPAGTIVTLTTDNGSSFDNVFNGTRWDDDADPGTQVPYAANQGEVTEHTYVDLTPVTALTPEEPLGSFTGENPNGTWTVTISDDAAGDGGSLNSWTLDMLAAPTPPGIVAASTITNSTPATIAAAGTPVVTSTIVVSGKESFLSDLNVTTSVSHTFSSDIDMTVKSPAGTIVTLTTDNGSTFDDVFKGTVFNDDADPGTQVPYVTAQNQVTEHTYANLALATPLTPEQGLGAFVGENPNGTWTLTISDDSNLDGGNLNSWSLGLTTSVCTATSPPPPADTSVTGASATAPAKQSAGKKSLAVASTVGAATEALTVKVDGVLTVKGKPRSGRGGTVARDHSYLLASQTVSLTSGTKTVRSVLNGSSKKVKKLHKKLLLALAAKQKASVVLTFTFNDAAGNHQTLTQTVKLKAPRSTRR